MDLAAYFAQNEMYFSESAGQLVSIDEMVFSRAFYSHLKLVREFGDEYIGTPLCEKFVKVLKPTPAEIRKQLQVYGKACHLYLNLDVYPRTFESSVRAKLFNAASRDKKGKVKTKKHEHQQGIGWIEVTLVDTEAKITVRSH